MAKIISDMPSPIQEMREGVRFVLRSPRVMSLARAVTLQGPLALQYVSLVPYFAGDVLRAGPQGPGALNAATGLGAPVSAVWLLGYGTSRYRGRIMAGGMFGFAVFMGIFAVSRSMPLSLAALFALGWSQVAHLTTSNTLVQLEVPDALRGRVLSLYVWLHAGPQPIGALLLGAVAQAVGAPAALLGRPILYASGLLLLYWRRPGWLPGINGPRNAALSGRPRRAHPRNGQLAALPLSTPFCPQAVAGAATVQKTVNLPHYCSNLTATICIFATWLLPHLICESLAELVWPCSW